LGQSLKRYRGLLRWKGMTETSKAAPCGAVGSVVAGLKMWSVSVALALTRCFLTALLRIALVDRLTQCVGLRAAERGPSGTVLVVGSPAGLPEVRLTVAPGGSLDVADT
jgi:hypothetical protein